LCLCCQSEGTGEIFKADHNTSPMFDYYNKIEGYDEIRDAYNEDIIKLKPKY
jgi:hypothetical protein